MRQSMCETTKFSGVALTVKIQERIKLANDVPELFDYFFVEPDYEAEDTVAMRKKLNPQATGRVGP